MELETSKAERLDQYVARQMPNFSRSAAAKLIEQGQIRVNNKVQTKAGFRVRKIDQVKIDYDEQSQKVPAIKLPVLYEDDDCVVIDKPVGLLTHSKGVFNPEATVATWLTSRLKNLAGDRVGIVHRLDRGTSGVMIAAKSPTALSWLQKQFAQRKVKKTYIAIVQGVLKEPAAIIDMPIERHPKRPQTFRVGSNGKAAVTAYKILQTDGKYSLIELSPTTGRTHQLRVHLTQLGHPILGDELYGGPEAERLFLHAQKLELTLPNKTRQTFKVPVPKSFKQQLAT